jgi:hypothetical protein
VVEERDLVQEHLHLPVKLHLTPLCTLRARLGG